LKWDFEYLSTHSMYLVSISKRFVFLR
jgi:hypothetical protein